MLSRSIDRACRKLRIFLDEIVNGVPPVPLKLYPEYEAMQLARGVKAAAPTDLFYPDLSPRAPRTAPREADAAAKLAVAPRQAAPALSSAACWPGCAARSEGAQDDARRGRRHRERHAQPKPARVLVDRGRAARGGDVAGGLESGFGVKQLAARIDLQIRRVAEGGAKVADGCAAKCCTTSRSARRSAPQVQAVQQAFRLSGLIPSAEVLAPTSCGSSRCCAKRASSSPAPRTSWLQGPLGPRRESAEAEADAGVGPRARRPKSATAR